MDESRLFVAAIDFGTTYSGYAFSTKDKKNTFFTCDWKNNELVSLKTPTTLLLDSKKNFLKFGYDAEKKYLSEILADEEQDNFYYFRRFKMFLHNHAKRKKIDYDTELEDENNKTHPAIDVFSKSIAYLRDEIVKKISGTIAGTTEEDIQYVLTVPAIWDDTAKAFMRQAAERANIKGDQLRIALEPEAASIFCQELRTERETQRSNTFSETIKSGTKYLVLDLGGGTADITVHERNGDGSLKEVVSPSGGPWGGTTVDDKYIEFLENLLGKETIDELKNTDLEDYTELVYGFEVKKRSVKATDDSAPDITITLPVGLVDIVKEKNNRKGLDAVIKKSKYKDFVSATDQKLHIKQSIFREFFETTSRNIVAEITKLFKKDELKDVKHIIMVGGFSECEIIQKAMKEAFGDMAKIVIPDGAGLAVLKGAVLFGHQPKIIEQRVLRKTYGIQTWPEFDPDKHPEQKKVIIDGEERCKDVFSKFAEIGEKVETGKSFTQTFEVLRPDQNTLQLAVYVSDAKNPRYVTDPTCQRHGTFNVPLLKIRAGEKLEVQESLIFGETELLFVVRNLKTGEKYETQFNFA